MNKKKFVFCALLVTICMMFSGCAKVYELTKEDEEMIAVYCAKTVSKFNTIKQQGYINLIGADLKEINALSEQGALPEDDVVDLPDDEAQDPDAEVTSLPDTTDVSLVDEGTTESAGSLSLTDALAIEGLTFDFKNVAAMDYYSIGGYADIRPASGKQFLVVTYNVINRTDANVAVDIPNSGIKFKATVGGVSNTTDGTIAPTDLSLYRGAIPAGHSQEMVLIFQFAPDELSDLSGLKLEMIKGTAATNILF